MTLPVHPRAAHVSVISGPTAVGKGTVVAQLKAAYPDLWVSVSATTRARRPGEVDGVHYHFVDDDQFDALVASDGLLEWATVHNMARYGTPRDPVVAALDEGREVVLEIDLQGARQVATTWPQARKIFLHPPSFDELVRRLVGRGTESVEERERRLATAREELAAAQEFDFQVVNDDLGKTVSQLVGLLRLPQGTQTDAER